MRLARMTAAVMLLIVAAPSLAHDGHGGGLGAGLVHPFTGADHLLAMVAVGLFAAMRGGRALWALPLSFVGAAALGFAIGCFGVVLPVTEPLVLASVLVLGLLVAAATPLPLAASVVAVAMFGFFHGQAHAAEAGSQSLIAFAAGFLVACAALHGAGLGLYRLLGERGSRLAGALTMGGAVALALA